MATHGNVGVVDERMDEQLTIVVHQETIAKCTKLKQKFHALDIGTHGDICSYTSLEELFPHGPQVDVNTTHTNK